MEKKKQFKQQASKLNFKRIYIKLFFFFLLTLISDLSLSAVKIIKSDFINQAHIGNDGPQFLELDVDHRKIYMLSYNVPGKGVQKVRLSQNEYSNYISEVNQIMHFDSITHSKRASTENCEVELIHTSIENELKVTNENICMNSLSSSEKIHLSQWFSKIQKLMTIKN